MNVSQNPAQYETPIETVGRRRGGRHAGRRCRSSVLHLRLGDRLLSGGDREIARARAQQPDAACHRAARACQPQCRARLCGGERQARGNRSTCRLRHSALRRRDPHRLALQPAGGDDGGLPADRGELLDGRRARRGRAPVDAGGVRPERHRAQLHQVDAPDGLSGQSRRHHQPGDPGGALASRAGRCI